MLTGSVFCQFNKLAYFYRVKAQKPGTGKHEILLYYE
jgi:hypothetical protein